jgi:hypothetical protein
MARIASQTVRQRFSYESRTEALMSIYDSLAKHT